MAQLADPALPLIALLREYSLTPMRRGSVKTTHVTHVSGRRNGPYYSLRERGVGSDRYLTRAQVPVVEEHLAVGQGFEERLRKALEEFWARAAERSNAVLNRVPNEGGRGDT